MSIIKYSQFMFFPSAVLHWQANKPRNSEKLQWKRKTWSKVCCIVGVVVTGVLEKLKNKGNAPSAKSVEKVDCCLVLFHFRIILILFLFILKFYPQICSIIIPVFVKSYLHWILFWKYGKSLALFIDFKLDGWKVLFAWQAG